jgi:ribosomal protein S12 methylthiotransferase accessory factor
LFQAQDVSVAIWDMTSDLGVACFLAGVLEREDNLFRRVPFALGSGCHLDAGVALSRALTEAAQTRLTNISGARDDTLPEVLLHARREEAQRQARAALAIGVPVASFDAVETRSNLSVQVDLMLLLKKLSGAGLSQVLRTDLSKPGWPISVVRIIVPGLEFLSELPGYVPGERALRMLEAAG